MHADKENNQMALTHLPPIRTIANGNGATKGADASWAIEAVPNEKFLKNSKLALDERHHFQYFTDLRLRAATTARWRFLIGVRPSPVANGIDNIYK
jgi:hypothetical protein